MREANEWCRGKGLPPKMVIIEAYMAGALEERKKWEKLANMIVRLEYCNDSCLIEEEINELKEIVNDR